MYHISVTADRNTFASLIQVLEATDNLEHLPALQHHGVKSARQLDDTPRSALRGLLGDLALDRLLSRRTISAATAKKRRRDIPDVHPRRRGNFARTEAAVASGDIDAIFEADKFAKTTQGPRESRWQTWLRFAALRKLDPLPLTVYLVDKMGAAFKAGGYRSAHLYFCRARQEHVDRYKAEPTPDVDAAIQHAKRSCNRGMGPDKPKDSFCLEVLDDGDSSDKFTTFVHEHLRSHGVPSGSVPLNCIAVVVCATWFLLRGLEIATAKLGDWTFDEARRCLYWDLPVSKTDTEAKGATRSHFCSCSGGRSVVCPYCTAMDHCRTLRDQGYDRNSPLFPDVDGNTISKQALARLAEATALFIHQVQMGEWPIDAIQLWAEHAFRVSGAQMFARAGLDLYLIQLLGRWGSRAIERYVQEAPLANTKWAATAVANLRQQPSAPSGSTGSGHDGPPGAVHSLSEPTDDTCSTGHGQEGQVGQLPRLDIRKEVVEALANATWYIHNPKSKRVHLAGAGECILTSSDAWQTKCRRWRYGLSSHIRHLEQLDGYQPCSTCFGGVLPVALNEESEESSSSSD